MLQHERSAGAVQPEYQPAPPRVSPAPSLEHDRLDDREVSPRVHRHSRHHPQAPPVVETGSFLASPPSGSPAVSSATARSPTAPRQNHQCEFDPVVYAKAKARLEASPLAPGSSCATSPAWRCTSKAPSTSSSLTPTWPSANRGQALPPPDSTPRHHPHARCQLPPQDRPRRRPQDGSRGPHLGRPSPPRAASSSPSPAPTAPNQLDGWKDLTMKVLVIGVVDASTRSSGHYPSPARVTESSARRETRASHNPPAASRSTPATSPPCCASSSPNGPR